MEEQCISLEELIFHFLQSKKYKKTSEAFATESGVTSVPSKQKRGRKTDEDFYKDLDKLEKKIGDKIFASYLPLDFVSKIVTPVRKIESALADLNRILRSNEIGAAAKPMQKTLYNRRVYSKFSQAPVQAQLATDEAQLPTEETHFAPENGSVDAVHARETVRIQTSPERPTASFGEKEEMHIRKTPNPKNRQHFQLIGPDGFPAQYTTVAIFEPDKWNQVVEQRLGNRSIVPDAMAEMINNCYVNQPETNLNDVVHTIEGNENLMKELESILADYCSQESSGSMQSPGEVIFREIDFIDNSATSGEIGRDAVSFATLTNMAAPAEIVQDAEDPRFASLTNMASTSKDAVNLEIVKSNFASMAPVQVISVAAPVQIVAELDKPANLGQVKPLDLSSVPKFPEQVNAVNVQEIQPNRNRFVPPYIVKTLFPEDTASTSNADQVNTKSEAVIGLAPARKRQRVVVTPDKIEEILKKLHRKK